MEEETMTPQQEGMMRTNQQSPNQDRQPMELNITPQKVSSNLEALSNEEKQLITQLNIPQFRNFMSKVLKNDVEPGFTIDLAHKDMGLAIEPGNDFRVGLPVGSSVHAVYGQARSSEFAKKDFSALLDYACQVAEIKPPRISD